MLTIKGYSTRYSSRRNAEVYATFKPNEKLEAFRYLNKLKSGCLGDIYKFWIEEENINEKTNEKICS